MTQVSQIQSIERVRLVDESSPDNTFVAVMVFTDGKEVTAPLAKILGLVKEMHKNGVNFVDLLSPDGRVWVNPMHVKDCRTASADSFGGRPRSVVDFHNGRTLLVNSTREETLDALFQPKGRTAVKSHANTAAPQILRKRTCKIA